MKLQNILLASLLVATASFAESEVQTEHQNAQTQKEIPSTTQTDAIAKQDIRQDIATNAQNSEMVQVTPMNSMESNMPAQPEMPDQAGMPVQPDMPMGAGMPTQPTMPATPPSMPGHF